MHKTPAQVLNCKSKRGVIKRTGAKRTDGVVLDAQEQAFKEEQRAKKMIDEDMEFIEESLSTDNLSVESSSPKVTVEIISHVSITRNGYRILNNSCKEIANRNFARIMKREEEVQLNIIQTLKIKEQYYDDMNGGKMWKRYYAARYV